MKLGPVPPSFLSNWTTRIPEHKMLASRNIFITLYQPATSLQIAQKHLIQQSSLTIHQLSNSPAKTHKSITKLRKSSGCSTVCPTSALTNISFNSLKFQLKVSRENIQCRREHVDRTICQILELQTVQKQNLIL